MIQPRTVEEIRSAIETDLDESIVELNNFLEGSFNYDFITAYAEDIHEYELRLKVAELAGFPNYAGKQLDQGDLEDLGIGYLDPADLNTYQDPSHLDQLGVLVGATRSPGRTATAQLEIQTADDSVTIEEGTAFSTDPATGEQLDFLVDADGDGTIDPDSTATVAPDAGETSVTVDAIAASVGTEYNVPAGAVTYMPSPPPGVESVTNPDAFTGGEDRQSTEDFRADVKQAISRSSGGGTEIGMEGRVLRQTDATGVFVDENFDSSPPLVDVVVAGGSTNTIESEIEKARPVGIQARLIRPDSLRIGIDTFLRGTTIDADTVVSKLVDFVGGLGLGDPLRRGRVNKTVLEADDGVDDISALNLRVIDVDKETFTYDGTQSVYGLGSIPLGRVEREQRAYDSDRTTYPLAVPDVTASSVAIEAQVDGITRTLTRGSTADYTVVDDDGDGLNDAIEFTSDGTTPDDGTTFYVDYDHEQYSLDRVVDDSGTTYTVGTDVQLVDDDGDGRPDAIDWSVNSTTPDDGEQFTVDYTTNTSVLEDTQAQPRQVFVTAAGDVNVQTS